MKGTNKTHATNGKDCISGMKTVNIKGDFGSALPPREDYWTPKYRALLTNEELE